MAQGIFVAGPVLVKVQMVGGVLEQLGISEDGVEPEIRIYRMPVKADTGGPNLPVEMQDMGSDAIIRMTLPISDKDVLAKVMRHAGQAQPGTQPAIGRLIYSNNNYFRLLLECAVPGTSDPINFPVCILNGAPVRVKYGTKYTVWRMEFYAFAPIYTQNSAAAVKLYDQNVNP